MEKKFEDMLISTRAKVKSMLNEKSSKEDADKVAEIDKDLDEMLKSHIDLSTKYDDMKTDYIELVKHNRSNEKPSQKDMVEDNGDDKEINIDEDLESEINNFLEKDKK